MLSLLKEGIFMTNEEMEKAITFLLDYQSSIDSKLEKLTDNVNSMSIKFDQLVEETRQDRQVIKDALSKWAEDIPRVITIADNMQDFARQVTRFVAQTEKRLSDLENK
jgi:hypothetical protein